MKRVLAVCVALSTFVSLGCNQHPVAKSTATGSIEYIEPTNIDGSTKIDIMWVIDNSGSMCQEQEILAKNFELFVDELQKTNLDFHIGVTTTHMNEDYAQEPVAIPGYLQSTPQPIPGFDQTCLKTVDDTGNIIEGSYEPILAALDLAVDCMETPDAALKTPSMADLACAIDKTPSDCEIVGRCDPGTCGVADLFPPGNSYRSIPKVLRSDDYEDAAGVLDVDRLKVDFACVSLVGTRGYGFEKGLGAAITATQLDFTGGPVDNELADGYDTTAPNHGLIRQNARFALIFVTDENDCTHDGSIDEANTCGDAVCEYATLDNPSALIQVEDIKDQLLRNLNYSKGRDPESPSAFGEGELLVASINGDELRFDGEAKTECSSNDDTGVRASCRNELGVAYSGDRYLDFLHTFQEGQYYPPIDDGVQGWLCNGDFSPALSAIGEFIGGISSGCITRDIFPCNENSDCPSFPFSGTSGSCVDRPNSEGVKYCDSGIQVRVQLTSPTPENFDNLEGTGYCIADSIGAADFPNGCVIDPSRYQFASCPAGLAGVKLQWENELEATNALVGTELQIRYNSLQSDSP